MTRRINIKVGSIVLREEPELFTGKLCVVPSQNFDNGGNISEDARIIPFTADIRVVDIGNMPGGRIEVVNYRLFPKEHGKETPNLNKYLDGLMYESLAAFKEEPLTFQYARVLKTVLGYVNTKFVLYRRDGKSIYSRGWDSANEPFLRHEFNAKFGEELTERIRHEEFFTFVRRISLSENQFDPRFLDPKLIEVGGSDRSPGRSTAGGVADLSWHDRNDGRPTKYEEL
ncbi:hypothetical protein J4440_06200 [Candidatus Woesearchaeota archaeon]|nr:hypothetical protein [Candidatus Woesearchaeota archaeon]